MRPLPITLCAASFAIAAIIVCISVALRVSYLGPRPIQVDEYHTLQNYTWAGVNADGTRRELARQADVDDLGPRSLRRMAIGMYCSLGRWPEPNNHVVHSVMANGALLAPVSTLTALRLPALLSCAAFALLSAWLCLLCGRVYAAPLVALLAMWHPYCICFSQEGRGYALMMALCVALVIAMRWQAKQIYSIPRNALVIVIAWASIANVVNLSVDWVMPVLFAVMFAPGLVLGINFDREQLSGWRRTVLCQILVVSAFGFIFLMDRLPYVASSAQQYGVPLHGMNDLTDFMREAIKNFSGGWVWALLSTMSLVGVVIALRKPESRSLAAPWIIAFVVSALHFLLAGKLAYARSLGYLLPALLFGVGIAVDSAIALVASQRARNVVWMATLGAIAWPIVASANVDVVDAGHVELLNALAETDEQPGTPRIVLLGDGVMLTTTLALPSDDQWDGTDDRLRAVEIVIVEKLAFPFHAEMHALQSWKQRKVRFIGPYRITTLECRVVKPSEYQANGDALAIWWPKFETVSVSDQTALAPFEKEKLAFVPYHIRYQAKLDVFSRLQKVIVDVSDSPAASESQAGADRLAKLQAIVARLGGHYLLLVPRSE